MKKILDFLAILPVIIISIFLSSCGDDSKDDIIEPQKDIYQVRVFNNIDKSEISSSKSDGNLYEVYVVEASKSLNYQKIGDIMNGDYTTIELDDRFSGTYPILILLKFGNSKSAALTSGYKTPEKSYAAILTKTLKNNEITTFTITEETTYSTYKETSIDDLLNKISISLGL